MLHLYFPVQEGLRTLCVAYRRLSQTEYEEACHHLTEAKLALQDREQRLAQAYDIIERDFVLLGATAVEDRSVQGFRSDLKMGLGNILMSHTVSSKHCGTYGGNNYLNLISQLISTATWWLLLLSSWLKPKYRIDPQSWFLTDQSGI